MKPSTKILLCLLVILLMSKLQASPSLNGPTGLITIPSAESLEYKEFNFGADYMIGTEEGLNNHAYKLNLGTFENWEFGVVGGKDPEEGMYLNLKYYLMSDASENPLSIALGTENLSSKTKTNIYMIASKKIRNDTGLHFGFKAIFEEEQVNPTLMIGANYFFNEFLEILTDINGDGKIYNANIGTRYFINEKSDARFFILDVTDNKNIKYCFGFSFSKFM